MKTKYYMIALAAMTMTLGSCSDSNSEFSQDFLADTPIKLNVSVDEPTTQKRLGILGRPTTLTHILLIRLKTRLLCFGQI